MARSPSKNIIYRPHPLNINEGGQPLSRGMVPITPGGVGSLPEFNRSPNSRAAPSLGGGSKLNGQWDKDFHKGISSLGAMKAKLPS